MTLLENVRAVEKIALSLPQTAKKGELLNAINWLLIYVKKHEEGDAAISDSLHDVCNKCQALINENQILNRKLKNAKRD